MVPSAPSGKTDMQQLGETVLGLGIGTVQGGLAQVVEEGIAVGRKMALLDQSVLVREGKLVPSYHGAMDKFQEEQEQHRRALGPTLGFEGILVSLDWPALRPTNQIFGHKNRNIHHTADMWKYLLLMGIPLLVILHIPKWMRAYYPTTLPFYCKPERLEEALEGLVSRNLCYQASELLRAYSQCATPRLAIKTAKRIVDADGKTACRVVPTLDPSNMDTFYDYKQDLITDGRVR